MKKNQILGIAIILLIAVVSIGAVLSYGGQTDNRMCQNNGICFRNRTNDRACDQSNCPDECEEQNQDAGIVRRCSM